MRNKQEKIVEIWRDVNGFEGLYQVSNWGRVKSVERIIMCKNGRVHTVPERILKAVVGNHGYLTVNLHKEGKVKTCTVHRLVAKAFLENPNNLPCVNHKNEVKTDNRVENLEWCSYEYNLNYGTRNTRAAAANSVVLRNHPDMSKQIQQIDRNTGKVLRIWPSVNEVARQLGYSDGHISQCANGLRNTHKGYIWRYLTN